MDVVGKVRDLIYKEANDELLSLYRHGRKYAGIRGLAIDDAAMGLIRKHLENKIHPWLLESSDTLNVGNGRCFESTIREVFVDSLGKTLDKRRNIGKYCPFEDEFFNICPVLVKRLFGSKEKFCEFFNMVIGMPGHFDESWAKAKSC